MRRLIDLIGLIILGKRDKIDISTALNVDPK